LVTSFGMPCPWRLIASLQHFGNTDHFACAHTCFHRLISSPVRLRAMRCCLHDFCAIAPAASPCKNRRA
jgi:hypothetical protein